MKPAIEGPDWRGGARESIYLCLREITVSCEFQRQQMRATTPSTGSHSILRSFVRSNPPRSYVLNSADNNYASGSPNVAALAFANFFWAFFEALR